MFSWRSMAHVLTFAVTPSLVAVNGALGIIVARRDVVVILPTGAST